MSSNLLKRGFTCLKEDESRVIDSNALAAKKISEFRPDRINPKPADKDGFSLGLAADVLEVLPEGDESSADAGLDALFAAQEPIEQGPSAEELIEQAMLEVEQMKRDAAAMLEAERLKVLEEARAQGYQEGLRKGMQEVEGQKQALARKEAELNQQYEELLDDLEPKMIDALSGIYEHIFRVDLSGYRDIIIYLIAGVLRKMDGGRNYIVHVSKEDYPYVNMQKRQIIEEGASSNAVLEIVEDITLSKNQALIETDYGIIDCSLGTQLSELTQKIKLLSYEKTAKE